MALEETLHTFGEGEDWFVYGRCWGLKTGQLCASTVVMLKNVCVLFIIGGFVRTKNWAGRVFESWCTRRHKSCPELFLLRLRF